MRRGPYHVPNHPNRRLRARRRRSRGLPASGTRPWSSRPRLAMCSRSSAVRASICRPCSGHAGGTRSGFAMPRSETSTVGMVMPCMLSRRIIRPRPSLRHVDVHLFALIAGPSDWSHDNGPKRLSARRRRATERLTTQKQLDPTSVAAIDLGGIRTVLGVSMVEGKRTDRGTCLGAPGGSPLQR